MEETITIPRKEYETLIKYKRIVDSEFKEKFSKRFIEDVKKSEEEYKKGEFVRIKNSKERKKLFASL